MDRLLAARDDLAWLPAAMGNARRRAQLKGWLVGGALASTAAVGLALALTPLVLISKLAVLGGLGTYFAGRVAGEREFRRMLRELAKGRVPLARVEVVHDGELVAVQGRIELLDDAVSYTASDAPGPAPREASSESNAPAPGALAQASICGYLHDTRGVYRRMQFEAEGHWIAEGAVDFALIDATGGRLIVNTAGARWWVSSRERFMYPTASLATRADVPANVQEKLANFSAFLASERVLCAGEDVVVVGYKSRSEDVGGDFAGYRQAPLRASLTSGPLVPLVIVRVTDLESTPDADWL